jgi:tricarballylate dehydrogenase
MPDVSVVRADTLAGLAAGLGIDPDRLTATVEGFNATVDRGVPFVPSVRDGRLARTQPPKSNWANPVEVPPFWAYPVTCAITFTFGGLHADERARVLDEQGAPIPGLFVCGEMVGGLFSGNYPGGSGLTSGAVFGRRAGSSA